jgi:unsaturated chondroitin disaccharide hydrolase
MRTPDTELEQGLEAMASRIRQTREQLADDAFPHWADPGTGRWRTTYTGDWTNGAWPGLLWLAGHVLPDPRLTESAAWWSSKLSPVVEARTAFKGFTFYLGATLGAILEDDPAAAALSLACADSLAGMFDDGLGLIPLGADAQEHSDVGTTASSIDSLQATPILLWAAARTDDAGMRDIALRHTRQVLAHHVRPDGSIIQSSSLDARTGRVISHYTHKGASDTSTWGRAQAWGMLYSAMAFASSPGATDLLDRSRVVCDWWLSHVPADGVAYWDFDDPDIPDSPRDTSATAIAAAGLLKLADLETDPSRATRYREAAEESVRELVRGHLTPAGPQDSRPVGMLVDGCFTRRADARDQDAVTNAELVFGSYFLFECLAVLTGRIGALDV